jgi:hypothetical protein
VIHVHFTDPVYCDVTRVIIIFLCAIFPSIYALTRGKSAVSAAAELKLDFPPIPPASGVWDKEINHGFGQTPDAGGIGGKSNFNSAAADTADFPRSQLALKYPPASGVWDKEINHGFGYLRSVGIHSTEYIYRLSAAPKKALKLISLSQTPDAGGIGGKSNFNSAAADTADFPRSQGKLLSRE